MVRPRTCTGKNNFPSPVPLLQFVHLVPRQMLEAVVRLIMQLVMNPPTSKSAIQP